MLYSFRDELRIQLLVKLFSQKVVYSGVRSINTFGLMIDTGNTNHRLVMTNPAQTQKYL